MPLKIDRKILEKLKEKHSGDKEQLEVIFSDQKRIIVEAPAGYGKTETMVSRIAYLIASNKVPNPKKILALTFSVNAAYKIKKDVAENLPIILSDSPISPVHIKNKVFATNYHGFCRRVLRLYGYLLNGNLRNIENLIGIDDSKADKLTQLNIGLTSDEAIEISKYSDAIKKIDIKYLKNNYLYYIEKVKSYFLPNGYITFNAILLLAIELFKKYPEILNFYRIFFPIIIIDEFQDTNILSWTLLKLLVGDNTEIMLMGDPLQRIYGFIGAIPDLMPEATKEFHLHKIGLKKNYRFKDNPQLLLLDKNIRENAKNPYSPSIKSIADIKTFQFPNQFEEAKGVLSLCKRISGNESTCKIAILVKQRGKNTDEILRAFKDTKFPFFYALYSDEDREYIEFHHKALTEFLDIVSKSGNKINKVIIRKFLGKVKKIFKNNASEIYDSLLILLETFLHRTLTDFRFLSMEEKIELIKDVLESKSLKQYLGYVNSNTVISTVHGAKGLEWDYVILPDMEQYSFPNWNGLCGPCPFKNSCKIDWNYINKDPNFEKKFYEELSVFYVAATRAKSEVFFTYSDKRIDSYGNEKDTNMSCFLKLPGIKMKIAILGWGSLIWNPRNLKIKDKKWKEDGPKLPVEFARISQDRRLTLVFHPAAEPVQVLWNYMDIDKLEEAVNNLKKREGTIPERIGFIDLTKDISRCRVIPEIESEIRKWAKAKGIDAVIWTDLPSNFKDKTGKEYNKENVIKYLVNLEHSRLEKAKEYIVKTPRQINTKMRRVIEKKLEWTR